MAVNNNLFLSEKKLVSESSPFYKGQIIYLILGHHTNAQ